MNLPIKSLLKFYLKTASALPLYGHKLQLNVYPFIIYKVRIVVSHNLKFK